MTNTPRRRKEGDEVKKSEVKKFRQILEAKQGELARLLKKREGIAIEAIADEIERAQVATERQLATRNLDHESRLLRQVNNALIRIDGKTYGVCLHCEEEINPRRLAAVPWAQHCIHCQELTERPADQNVEFGSEPFASTA
jgi:DnaK suppressor protein